MKMKTEQRGSSAVYSGNILILIGGRNGDPSVDCFNFSTNSWKKLPPIIKARFRACAVLVNNF